MSHTMRLGKIWNIPIGLHRSWVIIFVFVTLSLAISYMPGAYPEFGPLQYWLLAIVTSVLFFASVLAHELAHAWVAIRFNVSVRHITLLLFGGVAELDRESPSAKAEFWVAIAGPYASFLLAGIFYALSRLPIGAPELSAITTYLFQVNVILAIFNLLPAFPLDGGRILRAAMWHFTDYNTGTQAATSTGQVFAYVLMGVGVFQVFTGDVFNGLWLALIGLFLQGSASAYKKQNKAQSMLEDLSVGHVMAKEWHEITGNLPVSRLLNDKVSANGPTFYFVRRQNVEETANPHGMLTLTDISQLKQDLWRITPVERLMTSWNQLITIDPSQPLTEAVDIMEAHNVSQLPVLNNDDLVGVLSRAHIMKHINR